jgi:hypothetical protein
VDGLRLCPASGGLTAQPPTVATRQTLEEVVTNLAFLF